MNILTIDDEEDILQLISFILKEDGHKVFQSTTIKEAKALISLNEIDFIFIDGHLPNEDSFEFINNYRDHVPICVLSGDLKLESVTEELDKVQFIPKPFSFDQLKDAIATVG